MAHAINKLATSFLQTILSTDGITPLSLLYSFSGIPKLKIKINN